jgi:hypothetical protein
MHLSSAIEARKSAMIAAFATVDRIAGAAGAAIPTGIVLRVI